MSKEGIPHLNPPCRCVFSADFHITTLRDLQGKHRIYDRGAILETNANSRIKSTAVLVRNKQINPK